MNQPTYTPAQIMAAFKAWHADCEKHPEGGFKTVAPDNPAASAATLLGYLADA